jgi:hypothetical protein
MLQGSKFETPLLRYWRLLNSALERLSSPPVMFGEAIAVKACYRDPERGAVFVAKARQVETGR